ncbi:MAG: single-stranded-DNA-specific exonuclease RecJ [Firmicutes bacterium]|nr:single-stranded-DNA-specific exonuclease RecJ [Bacillota bacterium]
MIEFEQVIKVADNDYSQIEEMSKLLGISKLTAKMLVNRKIVNIDEARSFLDPSIEKFHDPYLMKDMDKAVSHIKESISSDKSIWIYGDYDVDGVTSTSVLILFLEKLGIKPQFYIPDRMSEGYGLNKEAIDYIKDKGGQLIITVDCGITSIEEVEYCNEKGLSIIITDHHQCGEVLPDAVAVINPNRRDCDYPFNKLAGVGVAFKLVQALSKRLNVEIDYNEILPIVAIGTVADVVSLTGENRIIVRNGLRLIKQSPNYGVKALLNITNLEKKEVSSGHIGFVIGPRINAGGRIGLAKYGVHLFTSKNINKAMELTTKLDGENTRRQNIEKRILEEAIDIIEESIDLEKEKIIVVASENWHHGVIGIVSSRITERYSRPSILISIEEGEGRGSARSISTFDIYDGLKKCGHLFNKFGGHEQAAGLSIDKNKIPLLRKGINEIANELLVNEDLVPEVVVDSEVNSDDISKETIKELEILKPFGIDNWSPQFLIKDVVVKNSRAIGKEGKHLKLVVKKDNNEFDCIGFSQGYLEDSILPGDKIDLVASLEINKFMDNEKIQFNIKQLIKNKILEEKDKSYTLLYETFISNSRLQCEKSNLDKEFDILKGENRVRIVIDALSKEEGILILINNFFNMQELIKDITHQGREIIKKTEISFEYCCNNKTNNIIICPLIEKIDFSKFKKVFVFDLFFDKSAIQKSLCNNTLKVFVDNKDIKLNKKILTYIVPTVDEMRIIYKSFLSQRKEIIKISLKQYITYLNNNTIAEINPTKLKASLDILKDCELIQYKLDSDECFIKLCSNNRKVDIENIPRFRLLKKLKDDVEDNYNYIINR